MTSWPIVALGEFVRFQPGVGFPLSLQGRSTGRYPLAKVGDISRASRLGKVLLTKADHYVDEADLAILGARPIPQGSVLFAKIGEAMRHNHRVIAGCDMLVDNNAIAAIPGPQVTSAYLYHYLRTVNIYEMASTTAVPSVRKSQLERVRMPLPPLDEQLRIAEVLDSVEALRAKRREAITQFNVLTHSIFLEMFGDATTGGETDLSTRLGELLTFITSGSRGWAEYYVPSGTRFVRSLDVQMNLIASDSAVFVDPPSSAEARRTRIQAGDVLLTITGSRIGRVAAAPKDLAGAYVSQHVAILRLDQCQVVPEFVAYFLSMKAGGQRQIAKAQYGQTKPGLNLDQIRSLYVPLPSVADQQEFKKRLNAVRSVAALQTNALATLDALFSSLQHQAFRGEL